LIRAWWQDIDTPDIPLPNPGDIDQNDVADAGVSLADITVRFPLIIAALICVWFLRKLWATTPGKILIIGLFAVVFTLMATR
jgi:hypothetical protein